MTGPQLPAIPDPAELAALADPAARILALVEPASAWLVTASRDEADDTAAKGAAVVTYLRQIDAADDAIGAAQTITLRARVRVGALTARRQGARTDLSESSDRLPRTDRRADHEHRLIAQHADVAERVIAELAPRGEATTNAVLSRIRRQRRQEVDRDARSIVPPEVVESIEGDGWTLLGGRATEALAGWPDASIDLIVTDPPYPADALGLWTELGELAARLLVPQGILVALSGKIMLPEVLARLGAAGLAWGWCYAQPLEGSNSRILARQVLQAWKPWLAFSRGPWPSGRIDWHDDMLAGGSYAKSHYRWEQASEPARYLIERLSPRGGVVLDPFTGSGTYGVAALAAGRRFVGVEADAGRLALAAQRLGEGAAAA